MNPISIPPKEASKRRRLVYASCKGLLSDKDSLTMVELCDKEFSHVETFTPFRFFKEAQNRFNLPPDLVKALVQRFTESQKLSIEALVDPKSSSSEATSQSNGNKTAEQIVFENLTGRLFAYMQIEQQPNIKSYLIEALSTSKMTQAAKSLITHTVQIGSFTPQNQGLQSSDMISVLDVLYSCYCELYGPVQTDRIFSSIMSEVETAVPEARQFSPRQFL